MDVFADMSQRTHADCTDAVFLDTRSGLRSEVLTKCKLATDRWRHRHRDGSLSKEGAEKHHSTASELRSITDESVTLRSTDDLCLSILATHSRALLKKHTSCNELCGLAVHSAFTT
jgi:hypothetical protein